MQDAGYREPLILALSFRPRHDDWPVVLDRDSSGGAVPERDPCHTIVVERGIEVPRGPPS